MITDIVSSAGKENRMKGAAMTADTKRVAERQHESFPLPAQPMTVKEVTDKMISSYKPKSLVFQGTETTSV
jgi:hypothetical protein